uniref:Uncharacterized 5 kDa protein in M-Rep ORF n=1 Tax=Banana bunchy top virus (isolate Autralia) TaxID=645099 RepID=U5_BBTVA|nr:RecName: Full=Uncharacterized 5 kDa protein in M-Rep ORF; AltName: Full=Uncharacterized protein U5 [Banana bunchy top virus isolate Autralia]
MIIYLMSYRICVKRTKGLWSIYMIVLTPSIEVRIHYTEYKQR